MVHPDKDKIPVLGFDIVSWQKYMGGYVVCSLSASIKRKTTWGAVDACQRISWGVGWKINSYQWMIDLFVYCCYLWLLMSQWLWSSNSEIFRSSTRPQHPGQLGPLRRSWRIRQRASPRAHCPQSCQCQPASSCDCYTGTWVWLHYNTGKQLRVWSWMLLLTHKIILLSLSWNYVYLGSNFNNPISPSGTLRLLCLTICKDRK